MAEVVRSVYCKYSSVGVQFSSVLYNILRYWALLGQEISIDTCQCD